MICQYVVSKVIVLEISKHVSKCTGYGIKIATLFLKRRKMGDTAAEYWFSMTLLSKIAQINKVNGNIHNQQNLPQIIRNVNGFNLP